MIRTVKQHLANLPGWRTNRKIVVFESDDWGSIRMSSAEARDRLASFGHTVMSNPYHKWDGLEATEDIQLLSEVLSSVKDSKGASAVFTLNYCSANPDFAGIQQSCFKEYLREPVDETYRHYGDSSDVISTVHEGINSQVFEVQFHGTEHLQTNRWMRALQSNHTKTLEAFQEGVFSPAIAEETGYTMEYMDALDFDSTAEIPGQLQSLEEGLAIFKRVWGFAPSSFIAPCYRWSNPVEEFLAAKGIQHLQGQRAQLHPRDEPGYKQKRIYHYTGQLNRYEQLYTVRNVVFEPSLQGVEVALRDAMKQIDRSFRWKQPAIISSHRINYTSRIDKSNRDQGLLALQSLVSTLVKRHPDVVFMGSSALCSIIQASKN